ncbi:pyridoxal phosphate-dependent aminotransferase [Zhenpiania hominis]|uniref:Pyridoxal phosphate-dependent aminotransferase n=1 Tax=Zhenpiania hominis TaxID=2763644 RepID=A0A923NPC0_9FIRM|nr:pyridoxal phosphate-dependent aminotransferase [Zhenpiania hominis]MBC6679658.1 pyridoxal phosphate-dependent aminotransferase [Zhenpiania hominis]
MKHKFVAKRYWKEEVPPMSIVDKLAQRYDDVIDLSLGDPDLVTDPIIIDKAFEDARKGHTKYTDFRGDAELRQEICNYYKEEYDYEVDDEEIFVTASGTHAMCLAFCGILDPGDEVIIHAPYYTYYTTQIKFAGGVPVILDCYEEEGFQLNVQRMETLITERTKAIVVNTPNNPTGVCMTRETLMAVAELAKKYDLLVVADDIYTAYSFGEPFIPMTSLPGMKERTITLNSYSKDYTMTGWRVGQIIAPPPVIRAINSVNDAVMFTAPSISQRAAIHAIRNRKTVQPPMIEEYKKRVFYAADRINAMKNLSVMPPQGTFYLLINIKKLGMDCMRASDLILNEAHVLTVPGISFGACGEGYVRIACTKEIEVLKEAFDRMEKVKALVE